MATLTPEAAAVLEAASALPEDQRRALTLELERMSRLENERRQEEASAAFRRETARQAKEDRKRCHG